jgi:hypothetical protein
MQPNTLLLPAPAQPLLLAAWSVTTTAFEKHQRRNPVQPRHESKNQSAWWLRDNSTFNQHIGWDEVCRKAREYRTAKTQITTTSGLGVGRVSNGR